MEVEYWKGLFQEIKGIRNGKSERDRKYNNTRMKSHLAKNGFHYGEVQLQELELTVSLGEGEYSLRKAEKNIHESARLIDALFKESTKIDRNIGGWYNILNLSFKDIFAKLHLVFVEDNIDSNPVSFFYNLGHEDGHFLDYAGGRDAVYNKYEVRKKYQRRMKGRESFADFCGWISVSKMLVDGLSGLKISDEICRERSKRTLEIAK